MGIALFSSCPRIATTVRANTKLSQCKAPPQPREDERLTFADAFCDVRLPRGMALERLFIPQHVFRMRRESI